MGNIPKLIAINSEAFISVQEYPENNLVIQGIRKGSNGVFDIHRIMFSIDAIKKIAPLLAEWIKEKEADND